MKKTLVLVLFFLFFAHQQLIFAVSSSYILPYPSFMPGNKLYFLKEKLDDLGGIFAWGSFSRFKYELKRADKYLVEAKVLYEYGQYGLGDEAISKHDKHFKTLPDLLARAEKEGKDISEKKIIYKSAALKHEEVLQGLKRIK